MAKPLFETLLLINPFTPCFPQYFMVVTLMALPSLERFLMKMTGMK